MNKTIIWILSAVVILLAVMGAVRLATNKTNTSGELSRAVSESDNIKGGGEKVLVEYSDFQCPACAAYAPAVKQLVAELGAEVKVVYRNFPLRQIHPNAQISAEAGQAAALQGKFWEMHDVLFAKQTEWASEKDPTEKFVFYASALGMDIEKFKTDLVSDVVKNKVNEDYEGGIESGVNSTPTFFLNGKKMTNPRDYEDFKALILSSN